MSDVVDPRIAQFRRQLADADVLRAAQQWLGALDGYRGALTLAPRSPSVHHNAGLCLYALARYEEALSFAAEAIRLDPRLWQALVVRVKILRQLGRTDEALELLDAEPRRDLPVLETERASLAMHELGNAAVARDLARQWPDSPAPVAVQLLARLAALYDPGTMPAEEVADGLRRYAEENLGGRCQPVPVNQSALARRRLRVGVISPQFRATPVFFFGIGALRLLAEELDLVFFHRGTKEDWATIQFRAIAHEWRDVASLEPVALEQEIRRHGLDVMIDMGGWMDTQALHALSAKPAKRMYKWVGGQAASTGLTAFDGFLSDVEQSPAELQPLYAEQLHMLDSGYVTYTPPPYLPSSRAAVPGLVLGVIANPAKISPAFLTTLSEQCRAWQRDGITPTLRFIEQRFRHSVLQQRILTALGDVAPVEFSVPNGHVAYLNEVARLHSVIDTFPYTGGLTTIEALMLGVPCRTRVGRLFCERHTFAHCRYAGVEARDYLLDGWSPVAADAASVPRRSLLPAESPRLQHARLAEELLSVFAAN